MRPYVGDGYDQEFYIKGEDGLYSPCRFSGRKMAHHQTAKVLRVAGGGAGSETSDDVFAKAIADRIVGIAYKDGETWKPLDDNDGNKLPINAATIGGLNYNLFCRLRDIVLGLMPSDADPEITNAAKPTTPEADAKN